MPTTVLNGWRIEYGDDGQGPPVVLIHGLLMDRTMFDPQIQLLKFRYRVITPDLRNHGGSESRAEEHSQWDMMEDQIALLDTLGLDKAVLGGVSQGGFQSIRAALKYPERIEGLILIETSSGAEEEHLIPIYEAFASVVAEDGWNDDIVETGAVSMFADSTQKSVKEHWMQRWTKTLTSAHAQQTLAAVTRRDDVTDRLDEIKAPALVIHGEGDNAINIERAEILASRLPNLVEFVRIKEAGHSATVETPDAVNEAIDRFLQKVYPA